MTEAAASARAGLSGDSGTAVSFESRLAKAVAEFGATVRQPLAAGLGRAEDQVAGPAALLVKAAGKALGLEVVTHAETPLSELSVRPDFAVSVAGEAVGFIEVKRPGKGANPAAWSPRSHDGRQWQKLRLLPNVLYTDGQEWALYRDGERFGPAARLAGALDTAGQSLRPVNGDLARVLEEFLWHAPSPPRSLPKLVRAVARLCRYLREEVTEVLEYERTAAREAPFTTLAREWREILFPRMTEDAKFADAYAQTITFALLLARSAGVSFEGSDLPAIGRQLGKQYALIGRALAVLADPAAADRLLVIETLRRLIGVVDWDQLGAASAHTMLYEMFLREYDPELRRQSGSYYTPDRLARSMVRFTDEILREKLGRPWGYADDDVIVVDPAMGTGTFLVEVVDLVAETVAARQGTGAQAQRLRDLFRRRLIGFERQATPYAVAEMRLHEMLRIRYGVDVPEQEMRFLADTFEDPDKQELQFGNMYAELRRQRDEANRIKRSVAVMAIIGNPPYLDRAHQRDPAPWIEDPRDPALPTSIAHRPSLDEFRQHGRLDFKLAATWVFYWRWAIWKAFEAHADSPAGIVAFITPSSYLAGAAFARMRSYLRHVADEAWIIDLSPERHQPPVSTRIFPAVQQPLCISVFARYGHGNAGAPARVRYRAVTGTREEKLSELDGLRLHDPCWQDGQDGDEDPFMPEGVAGWSRAPFLGDIFPWQSPGVKANRTWVIAPDPEVLQRRWEILTRSDPGQRDDLLKTTRDRTADKVTGLVPGRPRPRTLREESTGQPFIVPYAYRSLDRQYLILDTRVIDFPRPDLWSTAGARQVFISEPHTSVISDGPALTFTASVPDMHCYQGHHGGRVLPLYRDAGGTDPNIAPGLLRCLEQSLSRAVTAEQLLSYIAAVVAHPGYTRVFRNALAVPGIRVPLSADPGLWEQAVSLGHQVVSLHAFATTYPSAAPHSFAARWPSEPGAPQILCPIPYTDAEMPDTVAYDGQERTLRIGTTGQVAPVTPEVWEYRIGGMRVVDKWVRYRLKTPSGRPASSPLDNITATNWTRAFNDDLLDLLRVLESLVRLEPAQDALLRNVWHGPKIDTIALREAAVLPVQATAKVLKRPSDKTGPPALPEPRETSAI